ncbi:MAG: NAD(P)-binding domain-containing protein [Burkholderiaceae bacterium]|nr:NAD(P)-binding domain-containing protein [Burkholderiaceae bacterium]
MFNTISFIGAGRIVRIMLEGWGKANALPANILAYDAKPDAVSALQKSFPGVKAATLAECADADLVFGALHPPAMGDALEQIGKHLRHEAVLCSLAPVLRLPALQQKLGGFTRIVRMNPNAPSIIGSGFNPVSFDHNMPQETRNAFLDFIKPLGACPVVEDHMIEIYAVVTAMGPTYFWFQFEELRRMAEGWGMGVEEAKKAMAAMLHGAVDTMFGSDLTPDQVMDLVPVRPMAADEDAIREMLQNRILAIHARLHPWLQK